MSFTILKFTAWFLDLTAWIWSGISLGKYCTHNKYFHSHTIPALKKTYAAAFYRRTSRRELFPLRLYSSSPPDTEHVLKLGTHTEVCVSLSKTNSDRSSGEALFSLLENRVAAEMKNPLEISIISLLKSFQEKNNESSPEKEFQDTHYQFPVSILWEATIKLIVSILNYHQQCHFSPKRRLLNGKKICVFFHALKQGLTNYCPWTAARLCTYGFIRTQSCPSICIVYGNFHSAKLSGCNRHHM